MTLKQLFDPFYHRIELEEFEGNHYYMITNKVTHNKSILYISVMNGIANSKFISNVDIYQKLLEDYRNNPTEENLELLEFKQAELKEMLHRIKNFDK